MSSSLPETDAAPASSSPPLSDAGSGAPPDRTTCTNCDAELSGAYCGACGQRAGNRVVPLWQVTNEFLEDLFDLDLRILRTFPTFFFQPGQLTVEYVRGRRRRYIRPLRLYLFSSFLLFTVLAFTNLNGFSFSLVPSAQATRAEVAAARAELEAARAELGRQMEEGREERAKAAQVTAEAGLRAVGSVPDSAAVAARSQQIAASVEQGMRSVEETLAGLDPTLTAARAAPAVPPTPAGATGELTNGQMDLPPGVARMLRDPGTLVDDLIDRAPYLMFLLVPTFALLLKALYLRRRRLYLEHLIFALHVHALAFIAFALGAGLGALGWGTAAHLDGWMAAAPFGYLFVALRRVYGQPPGVTAVKALALLLAYGIILVVAVVLLVLATVTWT
jgi:hypothetical protein